MGALQPGLPNPAMIPEGWHLLIVDLKDYQLVAAVVPLSDFVKAREAHSVFHQNAKGLKKQFNITMDEAKGIVRACPECSHHGPGLG
ncbi:Endogenous retrovirus group K member 8 Pol protein, partial [Eudyptula minor]